MDRYKKVPVSEIISPDGKGVVKIYKDCWWIVTDDDCVLFYPQCNQSQIVSEKIRNQLHPGLECRMLPYAFVPWED